MKHQPLKLGLLVLALLLGGAIVNVAVAWGYVAIIKLSDDSNYAEAKCEAGSTEDDFAAGAWEAWTFSQLGLELVHISWTNERAWIKPYGDPRSLIPAWATDLIPTHSERQSTSRRVLAVASGWPLVAMRSLVKLPSGFGQEKMIVDGISIPRTIVAPGHPNGYVVGVPRVLPLRYLWPGFAINTIFYAAILWLLFFAPGAVRRTIRRKRGQCPACAYPVGTSPVCTECGKSLA
jgi:hypothetical protein